VYLRCLPLGGLVVMLPVVILREIDSTIEKSPGKGLFVDGGVGKAADLGPDVVDGGLVAGVDRRRGFRC